MTKIPLSRPSSTPTSQPHHEFKTQTSHKSPPSSTTTTSTQPHHCICNNKVVFLVMFPAFCKLVKT
ncbi:hypothetical protein Hanom_Chr06g00575201 [Helianthus anomalus]